MAANTSEPSYLVGAGLMSDDFIREDWEVICKTLRMQQNGH